MTGDWRFLVSSLQYLISIPNKNAGKVVAVHFLPIAADLQDGGQSRTAAQ